LPDKRSGVIYSYQNAEFDRVQYETALNALKG
jgi:hypothetical protein